jgi:DNA-binding transcriptional regulator YiaG
MHPDTLSALVAESGLSLSEFAATVAGRDRRTVQRWMSGEIAIPDAAAAFLERIEKIRATATRVVVTLAR